jgi:phosphonatase-like hydrolase
MTPDGRITSEFDDVTLDAGRLGAGLLTDEEWDAFDDGLDDAAADGREGDRDEDDLAGDDRDEDDLAGDDLADLELVVLGLAGTTIVDEAVVELAFDRAVLVAGLGPTGAGRQSALERWRQAVDGSTIAAFRELTADDDQAQHAAAVFESAYAELAGAGGLKTVAGAEEVIHLLRATGVKVALAGGFSRRILDAVLDAAGWRDLADVTLSAAEAGRGRPFPDVPLTALLRTGASSVEGMVVVGDAPADIVSGIAAGAGLVVGVLTGTHDERTLLAAGADAVLPSVADLPQLLGYDDLAGAGAR